MKIHFPNISDHPVDIEFITPDNSCCRCHIVFPVYKEVFLETKAEPFGFAETKPPEMFATKLQNVIIMYYVYITAQLYGCESYNY